MPTKRKGEKADSSRRLEWRDLEKERLRPASGFISAFDQGKRELRSSKAIASFGCLSEGIGKSFLWLGLREILLQGTSEALGVGPRTVHQRSIGASCRQQPCLSLAKALVKMSAAFSLVCTFRSESSFVSRPSLIQCYLRSMCLDLECKQVFLLNQRRCTLTVTDYGLTLLLETVFFKGSFFIHSPSLCKLPMI